MYFKQTSKPIAFGARRQIASLTSTVLYYELMTSSALLPNEY